MGKPKSKRKKDEVNVLDLFRLDGRVALITGGSKGLGRSMALALAQAGATTVVCARGLEDCEKTATEIASLTGQESVAMRVDVTQEDSVKQLFEAVVRRFGHLDVLINNAGVNIRRPIEELSLVEFRQVQDVNVTGSWLCCRAAAPVLKRQRKGSVINLASAVSVIGLPGRSAYCSAKASVLGMTRALAMEWAPFGVRCNALCPGPFMTEMNLWLVQHPEKAQEVISQTALNRWADLHEIRGAALFLASDASSYVTGSSLFVDGGWTAH